MNIYELIESEVTAKQAGRLYGLRFDRNGKRAFCPWHNDGKHPALAFFNDDKQCYCHVCHNGGNAVTLVAELLGVRNGEAAQQIIKDFNLNQPADNRQTPKTSAKIKERKDEKTEFNERWIKLCDIVHEADNELTKYKIKFKNIETFKSKKEWFIENVVEDDIDDRFDIVLGARCKANEELDIMWEMIKLGGIG